MNKNRSSIVILCVIFFLLTFSSLDVFTQQGLPPVKLVLEKELERNSLKLVYPVAVKEFYQWYSHGLAWSSDAQARAQLIGYLHQSSQLGLHEEDYQFLFISGFIANSLRPKTAYDSLIADFLFTDAAMHFFNDVLYGNKSPQFAYDGLKYVPDCFHLPILCAKAVSTHSFDKFLQQVEDSSMQYTVIKRKIAEWNSIAAKNESNVDVRITSAKADLTNRDLLLKLYQLGLITVAEKEKLTEKELKMKIKDAQKLFCLIDDGKIRTSLIEELNVPLSTRLYEMEQAINMIRWLRCLRETQVCFFVVNIPSANLLAFKDGKIILESKLIVGKPSTPTPTLTSVISEVILYPYWMVPHNIATKELLPQIRRDPSYLNRNNFQVVNMQGKVVNPAAINWYAISAKNFPYVLRQSTGCDNSLGLVKLNFYNPFTVYLHDTPWKILFGFNRRYLSHGCMRVEKAMDLARIVLGKNRIAVDTLEEKGCLKNQMPISVPASQQVPVFVTYQTVWVDSACTVRIYQDIYQKFVSKN
jgi:murein L,D-transpeptidase YcbB/YkuD